MISVEIACGLWVSMTIDGVDYPVKWSPTNGISWLYKGSLYVGVYEHFEPHCYHILGDYQSIPRNVFGMVYDRNKHLLCRSKSDMCLWQLTKYGNVYTEFALLRSVWKHEGQIVMTRELTGNLWKWLQHSPWRISIDTEERIIPHLIGILILSSIDGC